MAEEDGVVIVTADIAEYRRIIKQVPGVTDKEAKKAADNWAKQLKKGQIRAALQAGKSAKKAGSAWKEAAESAKQAAEGIGGQFGAAAGGVEKLTRSFGELSKVVGPIPAAAGAVALGIVGITLAVTAGAVALVSFIDSADDAIERLDEIAGIDPLPPATIQALKDWDQAALGAEVSGKRLKVLVAGELAAAFEDSVPIIAEAADGLAEVVGVIGQIKAGADATRPVLRGLFAVVSSGASEALIYATGLDTIGDSARETAGELEDLAGQAEDLGIALQPTLKMFEQMKRADAAKEAKRLAEATKAAAAAAKVHAANLAEVNSFIAEEKRFVEDLEEAEIAAIVKRQEADKARLAAIAAEAKAQDQLANDTFAALAEQKRLEQELADTQRQRFQDSVQSFVDSTTAITTAGITLVQDLAKAQIEAQTAVAEASLDSLDTLRDARKEANQEQRDLRDRLLTDEQREAAEAAAALKQQMEDQEGLTQAQIDQTQVVLATQIAAEKAKVRVANAQAKKAFRGQKQLGLTDVAINTAAAVTKAFALLGPPPSPAGIASAAAAVLQGSVQAGQINRQKPPQFHEGFTGSVPAFSGGPDERTATILDTESVLSPRATEAVGRENINELNQTGAASGGGVTFVQVWRGRELLRMTQQAAESQGPGNFGQRGGAVGVQDPFTGS